MESQSPEFRPSTLDITEKPISDLDKTKTSLDKLNTAYFDMDNNLHAILGGGETGQKIFDKIRGFGGIKDQEGHYLGYDKNPKLIGGDGGDDWLYVKDKNDGTTLGLSRSGYRALDYIDKEGNNYYFELLPNDSSQKEFSLKPKLINGHKVENITQDGLKTIKDIYSEDPNQPQTEEITIPHQQFQEVLDQINQRIVTATKMVKEEQRKNIEGKV